MIKAVIFDFCQTLVDSADGFRAAEKNVQEKIFADLALTDWQEFIGNYRQIRKKFSDGLRFSRVSLWQEVYWYYCKDVDAEALERWQGEYWLQVSTTTFAFPEAAEVVAGLADSYKLGLITNTDTRADSAQEQIEQFPELTAQFSSIILAGKHDVPAKPDRGAFEACLAALGVAADEAVFVGDDWRIDICGASEAGLQPVWLQHSTSARNFPAVETTVPIITSLAPLLDLTALLAKPCAGNPCGHQS